MFAFGHDEIMLDILALSKILGCGLPFASVSTAAKIECGCKDARFLWLTTHMNDPLTAAIGNKVLEIVKCDNICMQSADSSWRALSQLDMTTNTRYRFAKC